MDHSFTLHDLKIRFHFQGLNGTTIKPGTFITKSYVHCLVAELVTVIDSRLKVTKKIHSGSLSQDSIFYPTTFTKK